MSRAREGGGATAADPAAPPPEVDAVWEGLQRAQKVISSRYFYDTRGSELFVQITHLPEYYPTRTEQALLEEWGPDLIRRFQPASLLELGAGSARKTRVLLDAMEHREQGGRYFPLDVSGEFLEETARALRREYPHLQVQPVVGDLTDPVDVALEIPRPLLLAFLGSTLGNFAEDHAVEILANVAQVLEPGDHLLLGADLRPSAGKPLEELEAAYNDRAGVTAEFNRNALRVLNRRLGADFHPAAFRHRAFYDRDRGRIEMHLVATSPQVVTLPGQGTVEIDAGESIRTEISCKYDRASLSRLFSRAGLRVREWIPDDHHRYALVVGSLP